jgi:hypothetical protein
MEGYVASGDYNLSSELERMRKADDGKKASEPDDAQNADPNPKP